MLSWLRRSARLGAKLISIGSGTALLSKVGLLDDRKASVHWMQRSAISNANPKIETLPTLFNFEMRIATCAGGAATLDMMLDFVGQNNGSELAERTADRLLYSGARDNQYDQSLLEGRRAALRNKKISQALLLMEENIETPLTTGEVADEIGLSIRQLECLFARYVKSSPKAYYVKVRLERARQLLRQSNSTVLDVAMSCGFSCAAHFSRRYRNQFGNSPHAERSSVP